MDFIFILVRIFRVLHEAVFDAESTLQMNFLF